jgi:hypothetical protein
VARVTDVAAVPGCARPPGPYCASGPAGQATWHDHPQQSRRTPSFKRRTREGSAGARILSPVAELIVDGGDLVVRLTLGEKIWGFHGDIRVALTAIVSVAPDPKPWLHLRGWRMAGVSFAGRAVLGTRRHGDGYDFCALHGDQPAVQVDVASGRFSRLIVSVPEGGDPQAEAARIAAAARIAPSAPS